jgi:hypothetical protein
VTISGYTDRVIDYQKTNPKENFTDSENSGEDLLIDYDFHFDVSNQLISHKRLSDPILDLNYSGSSTKLNDSNSWGYSRAVNRMSSGDSEEIELN